MKPGKINRILLAPLDWGLGHATRCIPIIKELRTVGCEVVLAVDGAPAALLQKEFPDIEIKQMEGYKIKYSSGNSMFRNILFKMPGILKNIRKEHSWLRNLLQKEHFDFIISDNRPGFWSKQTKSIYITHQLFIHSGKGNWMNSLLQKIHARYIKNFHSVWVPDLEGIKNMAGQLSHPQKQLILPTYIGLLSRLEKKDWIQDHIDLLVVLSGPEPQRTIMEKKIFFELKSFSGKVVFVRGLPHQSHSPSLASNIRVYNHLTATDIQIAMTAADLIICRSGYTSLMDLIKLNKKAILIPTPGQPEQEYLAQYMQECFYFPFVKQKDFLLSDALSIAKTFSYKNPFSENDFEVYKKAIQKQIISTDK